MSQMRPFLLVRIQIQELMTIRMMIPMILAAELNVGIVTVQEIARVLTVIMANAYVVVERDIHM